MFREVEEKVREKVLAGEEDRQDAEPEKVKEKEKTASEKSAEKEAEPEKPQKKETASEK